MNTQERNDTINNMTKTAREWIKQLKPDHRDLAFWSLDESDEVYSNLADALFCAFDWSATPQGDTYWSGIFNALEAGTYHFTADESAERMATQEDYEELENIAPPTEPNFGTKDTNPKDSLGTKKVPLSGMPAPVLLECGLVKLHGDLKYGRYNWRDAGVRASVYYDASMRHLMAWYEGEDIDPDSGIHHLAHAMTGLSVLRDSQIQGNWTDDRPKPTKAGWIAEMNETAKTMIENYEKNH